MYVLVGVVSNPTLGQLSSTSALAEDSTMLQTRENFESDENVQQSSSSVVDDARRGLVGEHVVGMNADLLDAKTEAKRTAVGEGKGSALLATTVRDLDMVGGTSKDMAENGMDKGVGTSASDVHVPVPVRYRELSSGSGTVAQMTVKIANVKLGVTSSSSGLQHDTVTLATFSQKGDIDGWMESYRLTVVMTRSCLASAIFI